MIQSLAIIILRVMSGFCIAGNCELVCPPEPIVEAEPCGLDLNDCTGNTCDGPYQNCCHDHAGVGCDDTACAESICTRDPFCCNERWDEICAALACADPNCQCDPISQKIVFLECGSTVCGQLWAVNGARDLDAFWVSVPDSALVQWSVQAEVPVECQILTFACEEVLAASTVSCESPNEVAAVVLPGFKYHVAVTPVALDGLPCNSGMNTYIATLTCDVCFTDIDVNGVTNVDDLLTVINGWGPCEKPPCASDIDSNQTANVDDLIHVINRWGDCP